MQTRDFGRLGDQLAIPSLAEIQTKSYDYFLQGDADPERRKNEGLEAILREIFPIKSYDETLTLDYVKYDLGKPRYRPIDCRELGLTYGRPLRIWVRLSGKDLEEVIEEDVYLGEMPIMMGGGEFIINGAERVIVSQLHRSPGIDFSVEVEVGDRRLHSCRIIPERGSWIEVNVTKKDVLNIRIDQSSRILATTFLRAMDPAYSNTADMVRIFYSTKLQKLSRLKPNQKPQLMYVVSDIVDPETGEVIVAAGRQIAEQWETIKNSSIKQIEVVDQEAVDPLILNTLAEDPAANHQ